MIKKKRPYLFRNKHEWEKIKLIKKIKPLGKTTPYAWAVEPVHGCNLKCGHCSARLLEPNKYDFMTEETWCKMWEIINAVTPTCRVDLCLSGEPTLHPNLVKFLKIAREFCPQTQLQITTNGTMLIKGKVNYKELLDAGANIVYTDMYSPRESFIKLAEKSGYPFYEYYNKPDSAPSPWTYYGPHVKMIVLQKNPSNWPKSRIRAGLLGTWYNNLDWEAAKKFNLIPVIDPPRRRCNQPFIYVPVHFDGSYLLCCQDNMGETVGEYGSIYDGIDGFKEYWYGKRIQTIRRNLREKKRKDNPQCSRCCITFSRCDYKYWTDEEVNRWWDGKEWRPL